MRPLHPSAVPPSMIDRATRCREAGDWRGACTAAWVDVSVDLRGIRQTHGGEVADGVEDDLRHIVPDLLRWHLPRQSDGLLRSGGWAPLRLLPDGHALVAQAPHWPGRPQRVSLSVVRLDRALFGRRDDSHLFLRERWDSRHTADLLARCGGRNRLPLFTADGDRLTDDLPERHDAEASVERVLRLDESGQHAAAWRAAGFDLEVLLFEPGWSRDRIDPAAFGTNGGTGTKGGTDGDLDAIRRTVVDRSLAWLRPLHSQLADAAERARAHQADVRRNRPQGAWPETEVVYSPSGRGVPVPVGRLPITPWPSGTDERSGLFRIDVRGRCVVLDRLGTARPRARLVVNRPRRGGVDEARRRLEIETFGTELVHVPPIPLVLARRPAELTALIDGRLRPTDLHPLVQSVLFPGRPEPQPPAPVTLPSTVRIRCDHATHEVAHRDGTVVLSHSEVEIDRERVIKALGGRVQGCVAAHDGWRDPAVRMPRQMRGVRAALLAMVRHGDSRGLAAALDQGFDPHVRDEHGRTLLHLLPWLPDHDLLPRLLAAGIDVDARDGKGNTPLHHAQMQRAHALGRALVAAGAERFPRRTRP